MMNDKIISKLRILQSRIFLVLLCCWCIMALSIIMSVWNDIVDRPAVTATTSSSSYLLSDTTNIFHANIPTTTLKQKEHQQQQYSRMTTSTSRMNQRKLTSTNTTTSATTATTTAPFEERLQTCRKKYTTTASSRSKDEDYTSGIWDVLLQERNEMVHSNNKASRTSTTTTTSGESSSIAGNTQITVNLKALQNKMTNVLQKLQFTIESLENKQQKEKHMNTIRKRDVRNRNNKNRNEELLRFVHELFVQINLVNYLLQLYVHVLVRSISNSNNNTTNNNTTNTTTALFVDQPQCFSDSNSSSSIIPFQATATSAMIMTVQTSSTSLIDAINAAYNNTSTTSHLSLVSQQQRIFFGAVLDIIVLITEFVFAMIELINEFVLQIILSIVLFIPVVIETIIEVIIMLLFPNFPFPPDEDDFFNPNDDDGTTTTDDNNNPFVDDIFPQRRHDSSNTDGEEGLLMELFAALVSSDDIEYLQTCTLLAYKNFTTLTATAEMIAANAKVSYRMFVTKLKESRNRTQLFHSLWNQLLSKSTILMSINNNTMLLNDDDAEKTIHLPTTELFVCQYELLFSKLRSI